MTNHGTNPSRREGEQGFLLVGVIVLVALVLIALSVAAPVVAKDLRRERELEAKHRGEQYVRAIRLYYGKNKSYPNSVKVLEGGKPLERYLRQHYLDPMTGKDDWKLIAVGQAKTTVKGFFGQPLAGIASTGLGTASGLQTTGQNQTSTGGPATPGAPGSDTNSFGQSQTGTKSPFESGTTGPFLGVGIPKEGASIITLNEQTDYSTWEFIYDPRIEQLYAQATLSGGGIASSSSSLGSASDLNTPPGGPNPGGPQPGGPPPGGPQPSPTPTPQ